MLLTVHFHFTQSNPGIIRTSLGIRRMGSVVVVDDVSPVIRTGDVDRIRLCGFGVVGVPKTQYFVFFVCCVGIVDRESQEEISEIIVLILGTRQVIDLNNIWSITNTRLPMLLPVARRRSVI